ncbi:helicase HerA domain-containing protein [Spirillospora sp. CA-128828]|uniref:helicase HerA domain-containing protein n=1 Tax=Spirillospora sp. CA-128828 TaxID=3240033 RepID=UPI003D8B5B02
MPHLPAAPLDRVLDRVDRAWQPRRAAHHVILGQTGAGKTTLIKSLLRLRLDARVLIIDPKPAPDPAWDDVAGYPDTWGTPVQHIAAGFGSDREGGGPHGYWFRLVATPDREATGAALAAALDVVRAEGHAIVVIDDAREVCRAYRAHKLDQAVESVMNLGRSGATSVLLATQELGYVPGRAQGAFTWVGHTQGLDAAKGGAALLGKAGKAWVETMSAIPPYHWAYLDNRPGNPGPVLTTESL